MTFSDGTRDTGAVPTLAWAAPAAVRNALRYGTGNAEHAPAGTRNTQNAIARNARTDAHAETTDSPPRPAFRAARGAN